MFQKLSIKNYLVIIYIVIIFFLMMVCTFIFEYFSRKNAYADARQNLIQLADKTISQIDFLVERIDYTSLQIAASPIIQEIILDNEQIDEKKNKKINDMVVEAAIRSNVKQSTSGSRVTIYIKGNPLISAGLPEDQAIITQISKSGILNQYLEKFSSNTYKIILPPHKDYWTTDRSYQMISIIRPIINLNTYEVEGFIHMQEQAKDFYKLLEFGREEMKVLLFDKNDNIIFSSSKGIEKSIKSIQTNKEGMLTIKGDGQKYLGVQAKSVETEWKLYILLAEDYIFYNALVGSSLIFISLGVIFISSILIFYYFSKKSIEPLTQMMATISNIQDENLCIELPRSVGHKEFNQLREAFESMLARIRLSVNEVTALKEKEMKAHMMALQAQIDPHFIYNTLSMINAYTRSMEGEKIRCITSSLSSMLRYVSSYDNTTVDILDELEQVNHYLQLMKLRNEERLEYTIDVDEAIYDYDIKIPKLIIQPLVENSFKHGFKNKLSTWKVKISITIEGDKWLIEIADNGEGMDAGFIEEIYRRVDAFVMSPAENIQTLKIEGMGLMNVLVRLKFLYQESFVLKIDSKDTGIDGCKFTLGGGLN